jgi:hypothetical protein
MLFAQDNALHGIFNKLCLTICILPQNIISRPMIRGFTIAVFCVCTLHAVSQTPHRLLWTRSLLETAPKGEFQAGKMVLDGAGNRYMVGSFKGSCDFDPGAKTAVLTSAGDWDAFLAKYDPSGNHLWTKRMGGVGEDLGQGLVVDGQGRSFLTGSFSGEVDWHPGTSSARLTSAGGRDAFLARYDASGAFEWVGRIGGPFNDIGSSLAIDGLGNLYLTGSYNGEADFDPEADTAFLRNGDNEAMFLAKYEPSGRFTWVRGLTGRGDSDGSDVAFDGKEGLMVSGNFSGNVLFDKGGKSESHTGKGIRDVFLARYDTAGNFAWSTCVIGVATHQFLIEPLLALDPDGNAYLTGIFSGSSNVVPHGRTALSLGSIPSGTFLLKYDAKGSLLWARGLSGKGSVYGFSVAVDGTGHVYLTGEFEGAVDFDPGEGTAQHVSAGDSDIFLASYDPGGRYVRSSTMGGSGADNGFDIALDRQGILTLVGTFTGTADLDPGPGKSQPPNPSGGVAGFIAAFSTKTDAPKPR